MAGETSQEPERVRDVPTVADSPVNNTQTKGDLEVDDAHTAESVLDSSVGASSYLSSLKSSIYNYRFENGRRYHAFREGTYLLPNDEDEQDRMDLAHHIYSLLLDGKLFLAPLDPNPQRVLDLGTGTGIWAIDFADEHPSSEVVGNDLSPIQPEWNPPNCTFEVDDYEDEWLYRRGFDFIHARESEGCIADRDLLLQRAFQYTLPGGYIEIQGANANLKSDDGTIEKAPNAQTWIKYLREACTKFGKPANLSHEWKSRMIKAGFVDVHQEIRKVPIGAWPKDPKVKEIGKYQAIQEVKAIDSYTLKLFEHALGWTIKEILVLLAKVKQELRDPEVHVYLPVHITWGRKP
ncbi:hypothetical protein NW762_011928 [Fusarium torreyae]|uniref:Methyltransferase n=1 Tax=Fusarium torreyae TaxID=1237075 RepID=A0A9W8RRA2_9HYPO|nr:hypothetical protein NW762_011928 [Fusarium torreyae]